MTHRLAPLDSLCVMFRFGWLLRLNMTHRLAPLDSPACTDKQKTCRTLRCYSDLGLHIPQYANQVAPIGVESGTGMRAWRDGSRELGGGPGAAPALRADMKSPPPAIAIAHLPPARAGDQGPQCRRRAPQQDRSPPPPPAHGRAALRCREGRTPQTRMGAEERACRPSRAALHRQDGPARCWEQWTEGRGGIRSKCWVQDFQGVGGGA
jgi:hypothetical protein